MNLIISDFHWVKNKHVKYLESLKNSGRLRTTQFYYDWIKKGRFTQLKTLNPFKIAGEIDQAISVMNKKFGDSWDAFVLPNFDSKGEYEIVFVILYDKVTITNSSTSLSRELTDLLVGFTLYVNPEADSLAFRSLRGTRATIDYEELLAQYMHSHLSSTDFLHGEYYSCFHLKDFCIGVGTAFNEFILDMELADYSFDERVFESFLYHIDSVVECESEGGGPYKRIKDLTSAKVSPTQTIMSKYSINRLVDYCMELLEIHSDRLKENISFYFDTFRWRVKDTTKFKNFIMGITPGHSELASVIVHPHLNHVREKYEWGYYKYTGIVNQTAHEVIKNTLSDIAENNEETGVIPYIYFRDRKIEFNITEPTEDSQENINLVLLPDFYESLKTKIEEKLYENQVKAYSAGRYATNHLAEANTEEN